MEEIHKKVLRAKMSKIINRISSPGTLASCLVVLTPQDKERIECKTTNNGPINGATELVSRLMKRGSNAFNCFLEMLDDQDYGDLATEIRNEVVKAEKQCMRNQRPYHSTPAPSHSSSLDEGPVTDGGEGTLNSTSYMFCFLSVIFSFVCKRPYTVSPIIIIIIIIIICISTSVDEAFCPA